jgi:hypothetical protein
MSSRASTKQRPSLIGDGAFLAGRLSTRKKMSIKFKNPDDLEEDPFS